MKILSQNFFENKKFWGEKYNNWPNNLSGTNIYKTLELIIIFNDYNGYVINFFFDLQIFLLVDCQ